MVIERGDFNCLLFLTSGNFEITSEERRDYIVREGHFVFCFRVYHYEITALSDVEIVRAHFIAAGAACDMIPFNSIAGKIKKINYKFTQVAMNEPMNLLLESMKMYLGNSMHCLIRYAVPVRGFLYQHSGYPRPPGLLRRHLPDFDGCRLRRHGHRRGQGR